MCAERRAARPLTSAWMMFQAFFSPTLFSVLYSRRPSFRSFLAFSFTCQVGATHRVAGTRSLRPAGSCRLGEGPGSGLCWGRGGSACTH